MREDLGVGRDLLGERILSAMPDASFGRPATSSDIDEAGRVLGVPFPPWLRDLYLLSDGFTGPTGVRYLYPLLGRDGAVGTTLFLRNESWAPEWVQRSIIFADNGMGGSITTHWGALDDSIVEWCFGDGADFTERGHDYASVLAAEQRTWDEVE